MILTHKIRNILKTAPCRACSTLPNLYSLITVTVFSQMACVCLITELSRPLKMTMFDRTNHLFISVIGCCVLSSNRGSWTEIRLFWKDNPFQSYPFWLQMTRAGYPTVLFPTCRLLLWLRYWQTLKNQSCPPYNVIMIYFNCIHILWSEMLYNFILKQFVLVLSWYLFLCLFGFPCVYLDLTSYLCNA